MMLRSQANQKDSKISMRQLLRENPPPPPLKYPPNHIESDDQQSAQLKKPPVKTAPRRRHKIFELPHSREEPTFNQPSMMTKKNSSNAELAPQFNSSSFLKDKSPSEQHSRFGQLGQRVQYKFQNSGPFFPTMNNLNQASPARSPSIQKSKNYQVQHKIVQIKSKVDEHDSQIRQLYERFEKKCMKDSELEKRIIQEIKKQKKVPDEKSINVREYKKKITTLESENQMKKQQLHRYQLQLERARRVQELAKENQRLYQDLLKSQAKSHDTTQWHFKDQNFNSISALPNKNEEEESYDNGTIGELLSPFSVNPNDL